MTAEMLEKASHFCLATGASQREVADYLSAIRPTNVMIISDETVFSLYGENWLKSLSQWKVSPSLIPSGESQKSFETMATLWSRMRRLGMDRRSCVLALGGGVVTDVAGFAAATYMRGISLVNVPTTLTGMVDAAIGGKNGIDFEGIKNLVGTFHQPDRVFIDLDFLQTLPKKEYLSGLSEVIKYGEAVDNELFEVFKSCPETLLDIEKLCPIVERCCHIKESIVDEDEKDLGPRALLNFGHTFAHALESLSNWQLPHGQAVSIGISCAWHLSSILQLSDPQCIRDHDALCQKVGLPTALPDVDIDQLCDRMRQDKKATSNGLAFVLARGMGQAFKRDGVAHSVVKEALLKKRVEGHS